MLVAYRMVVILLVALPIPGLRGQIRVIPGAAGTAPPRAAESSPALRSPVTTAHLVIGGPRARGSARAANPGQPGVAPPSGLLEFRYDSEAGTLGLLVTNTCPPAPEGATPRITRILFNWPQGAVTGMTLVSQTAPGKATPAFRLRTRTDSGSASKLGDPRRLGRFAAVLEAEAGFAGGIAGESETASAEALAGPVRFTFALSGPQLAGLCASAFCGSFSVVEATRVPVNAALEFARPEETLGALSNAPVETAAAWCVGRPTPGGTVDFVLSGAPGSFGGIICSPSPGPTLIAGVTVPLGLPALVAVEGILPPSAHITRSVQIPPNPKLAGTTIHCVAVTVDSGMCGIAISNGFDLLIEPARPQK